MSNKPEDILNVPKKIRAKYSKLNDKVLWLYTESKDWDVRDRMMLGLVDFFTEKYPKLGTVIQGANIH